MTDKNTSLIRIEALERALSLAEAFATNAASTSAGILDLLDKATDHIEAILRSTDAPEPVPELKPAVPIKKSVTADYIVCLEDGKRLKMLKRHLMSSYNMTPDQYRTKWGLPADYPMVAPNYAKSRSELALKLGLGRYRAKAA